MDIQKHVFVTKCAQINYIIMQFKFEKYLHMIENDDLRKTLTSLRVSAHTLEIERGRYQNIHGEQRYYEPRYDKTGFLHMRKQRRRSASR